MFPGFSSVVSVLLFWFFSGLPAVEGNMDEADFGILRCQELVCTVGNNVGRGTHRAGYNGVFELTSIHQPENLFVPQFAGLNLEHVFDASPRGNDRDVFFEPRVAPMKFEQIDSTRAILHQSTLPHWKVESTTTFQLVDPYYLDIDFECIPRSDHFEGGAFGIFWASYINAPLDKSLYFFRAGEEGARIWQQFCTQYHNHDSTVKSSHDTFNWNFSSETRDSLFSSISKIRYAEPFFYGRFRNMVLILIFENSEGIRFSHSPSGGGFTENGTDTNPAWDFQWINPNYVVGKTYQFRYRVVYKKWVDRADVLAEVARFHNSVTR